jgi:antitoxin CcdA
MNAPFGPKRPVQLDLDAELVARAEALGTNLASTVETALAAHLAAAETRAARHRADTEAHCRATNALVERHGLWGAEFSTL